MIIGLNFLYELDEMKSVMAYLTYVREQITEARVIQIFSGFVFQKCLYLNSFSIRNDCDSTMFIGSENSCAQSFVPP
jgi:hypothetical protein